MAAATWRDPLTQPISIEASAIIIFKLACTRARCVLPSSNLWTYEPVRNFEVLCGERVLSPAKYMTVGNIDYANPGFIMGPAIRMRNWLFCAEQMTTARVHTIETETGVRPTAFWWATGFHILSDGHCNFGHSFSCPLEEVPTIDTMLDYFVATMGPILFPILSASDVPQTPNLKWRFT
jgi:hypothetical protein